MKKILFIPFLLTSFSLLAQTIVSTTPENKNVVLEEFTGIYCVYCPQGHAIAQAIKDAHPDDVFLINIHQGYYATPDPGYPDFRTQFGDLIANQSGLIGYPAGTVNRHLFSALSQGSGTAMSRGDWETAANEILAQSSYVNVGVEADLNLTTRELTVHVEAYYTGDSPETANLLNVAILQDSTVEFQYDGTYNYNYNHMHRLVWMLTGQWGEEINTTTNGSFIDRTYTYSIPAEFNEIPVDLQHIKIVAFITETHQEVVSGNGCYPVFSGSVTQNDAAIEELILPEETCENTLSPIITIRNMGQVNLTSLNFNYDINGNTGSYIWSGNLPYSENTNIVLDGITFELLENNTVNVSCYNPNSVTDDNDLNNSVSGSFSESFYTTTIVNLELNPGTWGFEISWELLDTNGTIIYSGDGSSGYTQTSFLLDLGSCYTFMLYDSYGNGFNSTDGFCKLTGTDGYDIRYIEGNFGPEEIIPFKATAVSNILQYEEKIKVYPNPASDIIFIENANNSIVTIIDISGKIVLSEKINDKKSISVKGLNAGIYYMRIENNNQYITKKITLVK